MDQFKREGVLDEFWFISAKTRVYQLHWWQIGGYSESVQPT
jgi:hypothetical protein